MKTSFGVLVLSFGFLWLSSHFLLARAYLGFPAFGRTLEIGVGTDVGDLIFDILYSKRASSDVYFYSITDGHDVRSTHSWTYPDITYETTDFRPELKETVFGKFIWRQKSGVFTIGLPVWTIFLSIVVAYGIRFLISTQTSTNKIAADRSRR